MTNLSIVPDVASRAHQRLEEIVDTGTANASKLIERVMTEVPQDSLVKASSMIFDVGRDGAVEFQAPRPADARWDVHRNALTQIAGRASIPMKYLDGLLVPDESRVEHITKDNGWRRELAQRTLQEHFLHDPKRYLVRSVNGEARGFLSDRYRRLDSRPLLEAFVQEAKGLGAVPFEGIGSDVRVFLRAIVPTVLEPVPGEAMVLGLEWANSDFGRGTFSIRSFVLRLVCLNGMIGMNHTRQVHLGGRLQDSDIEYSSRTYAYDTRTMVSATRDVVRGALSEKAIERQLDAVRAAHEQPTTWAQAFRRVSKQLTKSEAEATRVAFEGPDVVNLPPGLTDWRFSNALSWVANSAEDPERKAELQELAGKVAA